MGRVICIQPAGVTVIGAVIDSFVAFYNSIEKLDGVRGVGTLYPVRQQISAGLSSWKAKIGQPLLLAKNRRIKSVIVTARRNSVLARSGITRRDGNGEGYCVITILYRRCSLDNALKTSLRRLIVLVIEKIRPRIGNKVKRPGIAEVLHPQSGSRIRKDNRCKCAVPLHRLTREE